MSSLKKIFLLYIFLFPLFLLAQSMDSDFDDAFLDSLPEEVRDDLEKETSRKKNSEDPVYRKSSTYIEKPNKDKKSFYRDRDYKQEDDKTLKRFGSKIFSMMQTTLMPINEPNFDDSYVLDYGDVLEIQLIGKKGASEIVPIKRDGSITIKDIGKIYLAGLSLNTAVDLIKNKIENSYIGVDVAVTLVNIRDIQIIIAGNVDNPGPYTLNGNSNIFHALVVSGGPSEIGSFRKIDLIRNNIKIDSIDLYETFILGKSVINTRLRSGDVIFINPTSNLVTITGAVRRPGIYELKNNEDMQRGIFFANGITNMADLSNINLLRLSNGGVDSIDIDSLSGLNNLVPKDNDMLVIKKHSYRTVSIEGAVVRPGPYIISEGEGLYSLINRAGGYTKNAYSYGGILENENTKKINEFASDKSYKSFINTLSNSLIGSPTQGDMASLSKLMLELKNAPVSGRVSAEFDLKKLENDPAKDIKLQDNDKILIPEMLDQVYIYGEVSSVGTTRFQEGKDIMYYIDSKGGLGNFADNRHVYMVHPNGYSERVEIKRNIFMKASKPYNIYPGSVIYIPRKTDNPLLASQINTAYAAIIGNIAVTLTSLSVLSSQ